jgi:hypothetical protein
MSFDRTFSAADITIELQQRGISAREAALLLGRRWSVRREPSWQDVTEIIQKLEGDGDDKTIMAARLAAAGVGRHNHQPGPTQNPVSTHL